MKLNKFVYWFLNLTWGIIMSFIGFIAMIVLLLRKTKHFKYRNTICFVIDGYWGGLTLGFVILIDSNNSDYTKAHEYGHTIQNMLCGPMMPFIVCIPSVIRYWYFNYLDSKHKETKHDYDDAWFEGSATLLGNYFTK